jgi:hypothetical protein
LVEVTPVAERVEVDGIPVYWADASGPGRVSLVFRCGRADEALASAGLTHLIEHLALFAARDDRRQQGGFVDHLRTVFFASGSDSELTEFLAEVSAALSALPFERVELEKQVLLTEAASAGGGSLQGLMGLRFGAAGFGLVDYHELGLRRADAEEVACWSRERFVAENAAVWLTGPPPASLDLQLAGGSRSRLPAPTTVPGVVFPAYVASSGGGVAISFLGRRSTALTVALALLEQRLYQSLRLRRGLSYSPSGTYLPMSGDLAHLILGADCLDEHALSVRDDMLDELSRLAGDGPEPAELAALINARLAAWSQDESYLLAELDAATTNELMGAPNLSREELRRRHEELTTESIAQAVQDIQSTALLCAPTGDSLPEGFSRYESGSSPPIRGHRYLRRGRRVYYLPRRSPITSSSEGISYRREAAAAPITVRFVEVAAVLELGPGRMTLVSRGGNSIRLDTKALLNGQKLEQEIRHRVARELFVPFDDPSGRSVLDLARQKLGYRTRVAKAIALLPNHLQPGERVLTLASATYRQRWGLLALTNRRLLYLSTASARKPRLVELSISEVTRARRGRLELFGRSLVVTASGTTRRFSYLTPSERTTEFLQGLASPTTESTNPQTIDTSLRDCLTDYASGLFFLIGGLSLLLLGEALALFPFLLGSTQLLRTFLRRRKRRNSEAAQPEG